MKKNIIFFLFLFFATLQSASAHPPSKIEAAYNPYEKTLAVIVTHRVNNPDKHFIHKIEVLKNGKIIAKQNFQKQNNATTQTATFNLPKTGVDDTVEVAAYCNVSGMLTEQVDLAEVDTISGATVNNTP